MFSLIWGLVSGTGNAILNNFTMDEERRNLINERDYLSKQYQEQIELMDLMFEEAIDEANKKADNYDRQAGQLDKEALLTDKQTTLNEQYVSNSFNNEFKQLQAEQASNLFDYNNQAMAIGQNEGDQLSAIASSGTRAGGSATQATALQTNALQNEFQNAQNLTRLNSELKTYNLFNNLNKNINDIQGKRYDADFMRDNAGMYRINANDLRESYSEGGYEYQIYQQKKKMKTTEYEKSYEDYTYGINQLNDNGYRFRRGMTAFFGGMSEGLRTGQQLQSVYDNAWGNS